MKFMKQCKRSCLTIDDFNNALKESNVEVKKIWFNLLFLVKNWNIKKNLFFM